MRFLKRRKELNKLKEELNGLNEEEILVKEHQMKQEILIERIKEFNIFKDNGVRFVQYANIDCTEEEIVMGTGFKYLEKENKLYVLLQEDTNLDADLKVYNKLKFYNILLLSWLTLVSIAYIVFYILEIFFDTNIPFFIKIILMFFGGLSVLLSRVLKIDYEKIGIAY